MPRLPILLILALLLQAALGATSCLAASAAATPFYTFNQSPVAQIFGLPAAESSTVQLPGKLWSLFAFDVANNYSIDDSPRDSMLIDAESYRLTFALRYGIAQKFELGLDLPLVGYSGGVLDGMIEGWHSAFGLSQGGRLYAPRDRLLIRYDRNNQERLRLTRENFGLGDLRLNGGWQLYQDGSSPARALALRASLKVPTGDSEQLRGSGSTDFALWLTGSDDHIVGESQMHLAFFGAAGAMALTKGRVLEDQQNQVVGFGSLGLGWSPLDWLTFKTQLSMHSAFFKSTTLNQLGQSPVQLIFGGTLGFSPKTSLDIALSEDVRVSTSPDLAIHLGLSHQF